MHLQMQLYQKVNVITGKAFGSAYVTMNSKAIGADMVYAWPEAEIGMMAADMAAKIMYTDADADTLKAKTEEYKALQSSPLSAAWKRICRYHHRTGRYQKICDRCI